MRELWLMRTTVNKATVGKRNAFGVLESMTDEMSIPDAQRYIAAHQRELTCYKIAYKGTRKNAVRHLRNVCYFGTDEEAVRFFETVQMPGYTLQLLTGDWRLLAEKAADIIDQTEKENDDHGKTEE